VQEPDKGEHPAPGNKPVPDEDRKGVALDETKKKENTQISE